MANIVYMARSAWTGLLDTIRSKAGITGSMTVSQAAEAVENIETGSGIFELIYSQDLGHIEGTSTAVDITSFTVPCVGGDLYFVLIESNQTTGLKATYTWAGEKSGQYTQARLYLVNLTNYTPASSSSGVYPSFSLNASETTITIKARSTSTSGTVNGNYTVKVYKYVS